MTVCIIKFGITRRLRARTVGCSTPPRHCRHCNENNLLHLHFHNFHNFKSYNKYFPIWPVQLLLLLRVKPPVRRQWAVSALLGLELLQFGERRNFWNDRKERCEMARNSKENTRRMRTLILITWIVSLRDHSWQRRFISICLRLT